MSPIEVTQKVFEHFGNGNIPGILEWLADDIEINFYGPSTIPYAGNYKGKAEAEKFFSTVLSSLDINQFDPEQFLSDGDMVTVTGHLNLTARSTGGTIDSDFAHIITVRDGKWQRFRDFMDTSVAHAAFTLSTNN